MMKYCQMLLEYLKLSNLASWRVGEWPKLVILLKWKWKYKQEEVGGVDSQSVKQRNLAEKQTQEFGHFFH